MLVGVFLCMWALCQSDINNVIKGGGYKLQGKCGLGRVRTLGHMVSSRHPEHLETEIRHMDNQACLFDGA